MSFTIVSALRWWMRDQPQAVALNIDGAAVSYGELYDWTRGVAARLMEAGVKPGDRVGILATQALEYYALAIGMQFVGAVVVPLNIRFTERELHTAVEDTTPVLLFADADRWVVAQKTVEGSGLRLRKLSDVTGWRDPPADEIPHHAEGGDLVAIMSTSGSTAKPKFVKFTHAMVVSVALELQLIEPTVRKCRALLFAPPFSGGLYCVYEYLVLGGSVFLQSRFDPKAALDTILDEGITLMPTTPVFLEQIALQPRFPSADLSPITWSTIGGSRVPPDLVKLYRSKGVMLRCLFGQTEAGAAWAATGKALEDPMQAGYGGPFTEWRIMADGAFLGPGEVGEIVLRSPVVSPGYWENDEATAQTFRDGWLHTGDLGKVDALGGLTFVDRMKDIIISGGLNISPAEVEQVISGIEGVVEVAVIAADDPKFGETPLAVIHADRPIDLKAVIAHCDLNLANYKVPRYVALETEPLPRLATGKISKPLLRDRYKGAAQRLPKLR